MFIILLLFIIIILLLLFYIIIYLFLLFLFFYFLNMAPRRTGRHGATKLNSLQTITTTSHIIILSNCNYDASKFGIKIKLP